MEASGSSSHRLTTQETVVLDEDPYPEPVYVQLVITLMNPPLQAPVESPAHLWLPSGKVTAKEGDEV